MSARQIQRIFHYTVGRIYQLEDIRPLVSKLKTVSSKRVKGSIFHLYREIGTHNMWMEGPFSGSGSSGFMFLGLRETKSQFKKFLVSEFKLLVSEFVARSTELILRPGISQTHGRLSRQDYEQLLKFDLDSW